MDSLQFCAIYFKILSNKSKLNVGVHTMKNSHKCKFCGKSFNSRSNLTCHISGVHEGLRRVRKKQFKCNVSSLEVYQRGNLFDHMRTHTGERPFKCEFDDCGVGFKLEFHLKRHIKHKHSSERPFKYDFPGCLYTAKTSSNLISHEKVHSDDRPFACSHSGCNFRSKRKEDLSSHTATVHSCLKIISCSRCNYRTNYARNLARHMIVHEGRHEKIQCSIQGCEYKGKNRRALKLHMRRHKTLLPCPVSSCGRHVISKEALKKHIELHNPLGRRFQCPYCLKRFATLFKLQRHCVVHTNEKPFECGHCEYAASFRSLVRSHIFRAHANVEFPFIVHLLDDRECLHCKVSMPTADFVVHCKSHGV